MRCGILVHMGYSVTDCSHSDKEIWLEGMTLLDPGR